MNLRRPCPARAGAPIHLCRVTMRTIESDYLFVGIRRVFALVVFALIILS
jgi:hypothetical protein